MPKALIIDDEEVIRVTSSMILERVGIKTFTASGWDQAELILREEELDVVFLDILMPNKSGIEVLKEIRNYQPETLVIMMTGHPTVKTNTEAMRLGAHDYLTKPVDRQVLVQIAMRAIERKKLIDQKKKLEEKNEEFQKRIESMVVDNLEIFENEESFKEMVKDLVEHRKKITEKLSIVREKVRNAVDIMNSTN